MPDAAQLDVGRFAGFVALVCPGEVGAEVRSPLGIHGASGMSPPYSGVPPTVAA